MILKKINLESNKITSFANQTHKNNIIDVAEEVFKEKIDSEKERYVIVDENDNEILRIDTNTRIFIVEKINKYTPNNLKEFKPIDNKFFTNEQDAIKFAFESSKKINMNYHDLIIIDYDFDGFHETLFTDILNQNKQIRDAKEKLVDFLYENFYNPKTNEIDLSNLDFRNYKCNINLNKMIANQIMFKNNFIIGNLSISDNTAFGNIYQSKNTSVNGNIYQRNNKAKNIYTNKESALANIEEIIIN